jgi:tight adherence protein C
MVQMAIVLTCVFISVGLLTSVVAWPLIARTAPERRRLDRFVRGRAGRQGDEGRSILDQPARRFEGVTRWLPKSAAEMGRLRKRLARAGFHSLSAAGVYATAEVLTPLVFGGTVLLLLGTSRILFAVLAAIVGYLLPGLALERMIARRKKQISNGLPDALDLLIVCLEAGSSLDQAIVKVTEELAISHPALAGEFRLLNLETRAGKPRVEAFRNLATRTDVDDVRSLVSMLVQTDRFGTSVAQALRVHAATSRTKRRQRAEERAAKIGVKLVFPLVFCLFPAFYVVTLGPAVIDFVRFFSNR